MIDSSQQKSKYEAPRLVEFGSVRNLTGGSGGIMQGDAGLNMMV